MLKLMYHDGLYIRLYTDVQEVKRPFRYTRVKPLKGTQSHYLGKTSVFEFVMFQGLSRSKNPIGLY